MGHDDCIFAFVKPWFHLWLVLKDIKTHPTAHNCSAASSSEAGQLLQLLSTEDEMGRMQEQQGGLLNIYSRGRAFSGMLVAARSSLGESLQLAPTPTAQQPHAISMQRAAISTSN